MPGLLDAVVQGIEGKMCERDLGDSMNILVIGYVTTLKSAPSYYLQKELILEKNFSFSQGTFLLV